MAHAWRFKVHLPSSSLEVTPPGTGTGESGKNGDTEWMKYEAFILELAVYVSYNTISTVNF